MNHQVLVLTVATECNTRVARCVDSVFEYQTRVAPAGIPRRSTDSHTHAPMIADLVQVFPSGDRFPDFGGVRIRCGHAVSSLIGNGLTRPVQSLKRLRGPLVFYHGSY